MNNEQSLDKSVDQQSGQAIRMDLVIKEYEIIVQDLLRETVMLKALLAQKNEEGNQGTE